MGTTSASVQDCTELSSISQLKDLMNDYDYLKNVLNKFSIRVKMFHSQFHKEIVIFKCLYFVFFWYLPREQGVIGQNALLNFFIGRMFFNFVCDWLPDQMMVIQPYSLGFDIHTDLLSWSFNF